MGAEGSLSMQVDGTYTFPASLERVFAALVDPDMLAHAVPGCERAIQLGPADEHGTLTLELRLRAGPGPAVYTTTAEVVPQRNPTQIRAEVHGLGPHGPIVAHGTLRLSEEGVATRGMYRWEIEPDSLRPEQQALLGSGAGQRLAELFFEQLAASLHAGGALNGKLPGATVVETRTPRGRIVALPGGTAVPADRPENDDWPRQAVWMSAGLVVGLGALALTISLVRRLRPRNEG
jgi:carbon monoxide dehydrogenase subunit G